jgi:membrane-anchored mycosin MYCP
MMRAVGATLALAGALALAPAAPAVAAPFPSQCASPGQSAPQVSWPQLALSLDRTGPLTRGGGQTVAVLSTGVDGNQIQLRGRVFAGASEVGGGAANTDCLGTGTQIAGVIAAAKLHNAAFAGVAPAAAIFPVRVVDSIGNQVDPAVLANGVRAATAAHVGVICVPVAVYRDTPALRGAVEGAIAAGIPVVAASGDNGDNGNPTPYPAAYPGVIAVTALDSTGEVLPAAGSGDYVTLGGPGKDVVTTQTRRGLVGADGTGVASGFVAGTVALIRSRRPGITPDAMARLLIATANATPTVPGDTKLAGLVDPYRALTERVAGGPLAPLIGYQPPAASGSDRAQARIRERALLIAGGAVLLTVILVLIAVVTPRARRRSWRSMLAPPRPRDAAPADPSPPVPLFPGSDR